MSTPQQSRGLGAAVGSRRWPPGDGSARMALQEVDREKRRLISGGLFLAIGGVSMLLALLAAEVALVLWIEQTWSTGLLQALLVLATVNLVLAGLSLRIGGDVLKGPFLPQTLEGLSRTLRAVMGR